MVALTDTKFDLTATVIPFEPMAVTFENVQYFVDAPKVRDISQLEIRIILPDCRNKT